MIVIIFILRGGECSGVDPGYPRYFYAGGEGRLLFVIGFGISPHFIRGGGREGERRGGVIFIEIGLRFQFNFFRFQSGF